MKGKVQKIYLTFGTQFEEIKKTVASWRRSVKQFNSRATALRRNEPLRKKING